MKNDEWLTPKYIVRALGKFDLDPCAPTSRPWPTAKRHISKPRDGLSSNWEGRVWLNPPFGREQGKWLAKLAAHGNGMALIAARTETRYFFDYVWAQAGGVLFLKGRPHFCYVNGMPAKANSGAPICLVAYGIVNETALMQAWREKLPGMYVDLPSPWSRPKPATPPPSAAEGKERN